MDLQTVLMCWSVCGDHPDSPHDNIIAQLVLEIRYPHTNICHINSLSVNISVCERHERLRTGQE